MTTGREDEDVVFQVTRNGDRCSQPLPPSILIGLWGKRGSLGLPGSDRPESGRDQAREQGVSLGRLLSIGTYSRCLQIPV